MKEDSDSDLSEEINDQLNQLWTNAKDKRKELLSHLTSYSKANNKGSLNQSLQPKGFREREAPSDHHTDPSHSTGLIKEVVRLRQQLEQEVSQGKHQQIELQRLRQAADKLTQEKQYLAKQRQQTLTGDENNSKALNESSILARGKPRSSSKAKQPRRKEGQDRAVTEKAEDLCKQRLVQLVRSTSEYRSYVFYYDSNELSYLKRLNDQHRRNCDKIPGQKERQFWAPTHLLRQLQALNQKEQLKLTQRQLQKMVLRLKPMFEANEGSRVEKRRRSLEAGLRKVERAGQSRIPYEVVQVSRAREREAFRWSSSKRSSSLFR